MLLIITSIVTSFFGGIYNVSQKNIPDIFDCNFKTSYHILIVLVRIFLTQLAIR